MNEADTCRKYVVPRLQAAGWDTEPHRINEQVTFTDGRIIPIGSHVRRGKEKRADYLLRYNRDLKIAVVEAKADYKTPGSGLGQAKAYAQILGLKFAYSTNGHGIVEFDFLTGMITERDDFPTPDELFRRLRHVEPLSEQATEVLGTPGWIDPEKPLRYYQEIAINRSIEEIVRGTKRILLTMATGTGKTQVAFQLCWKLWNSRWNLDGEHRRPKVLYLSDRNILVDDPKDRDFVPFGEARYKIERGEVIKSRDMYFAIYQAIAEDERRAGLYRQYAPDFFDLVIVDECHRGSAREDGNWREILEYFAPATQLGMTATPLRNDNRNTYEYFGNPIYTYSLRQGIEDGFLAPYRVNRVITDVDAAGWRPQPGQRDRAGREIPDYHFGTREFDRELVLKARTQAIARHLTDHLKKTDRFAKTIVFCVDQEHAERMRDELTRLNADLVRKHPNYVERVTADEGFEGRAQLSLFQDLETDTPVILTTSQLLTTGVDAPMVKNIVLARVVGSISEFKQIIGRGTRVRTDYGKYFFTILDYTGSATQHFADPDFDGDPSLELVQHVNDQGEITEEETIVEEEIGTSEEEIYASSDVGAGVVHDAPEREERKFYVDDGVVLVIAEIVYELDEHGNTLQVSRYTDYAGRTVNNLWRNSATLRSEWLDFDKRRQVIAELERRGISFDDLAALTGQHEADPFDLLCHIAFNAPLRTRRERAERLRRDQRDIFEEYGDEARDILNALLDKYIEHGVAQFTIPEILKVSPIAEHGNVSEIIDKFGGADRLRAAVARVQSALYTAI